MSGGLIIRKLVSAIVSCVFVMFICFLIEPSGFAIFIGVFLFPILLLYGLPTSILSDFVTKKLKGVVRVGIAVVIHLTFAAAFAMMFGEEDWAPMNFFLFLAIVSAFLFLIFDEFLKLHDAKQIRKDELQTQKE